jgi:hypothetical protein
MYFLFLVAFLQLEDVPSKAMSPPVDLVECQKRARALNADPRLQTEEAKEMGLRFVCMSIVPDA